MVMCTAKYPINGQDYHWYDTDRFCQQIFNPLLHKLFLDHDIIFYF